MSKGIPSPPKYEVPEEVKEKARSLLKDFMKQENVNAEQLALKLNATCGRPASRTNILNKFSRASFSLTEFIQILDAFGYELSIKKTDETMKSKKTL